MDIKVTVELNQQAIKQVEEAAKKALPLTMEVMKSEIISMQVVPKETGNLEESAIVGVKNGVGFISFSTPYARRLYYHPEYNFRTDKNSHAQGRWLDSFIHGPKKKWLEETLGKFIKQLSKGVIK